MPLRITVPAGDGEKPSGGPSHSRASSQRWNGTGLPPRQDGREQMGGVGGIKTRNPPGSFVEGHGKGCPDLSLPLATQRPVLAPDVRPSPACIESRFPMVTSVEARVAIGRQIGFQQRRDRLVGPFQAHPCRWRCRPAPRRPISMPTLMLVGLSGEMAAVAAGCDRFALMGDDDGVQGRQFLGRVEDFGEPILQPEPRGAGEVTRRTAAKAGREESDHAMGQLGPALGRT